MSEQSAEKYDFILVSKRISEKAYTREYQSMLLKVVNMSQNWIPELRKPYFAENHDDVGKPLVVVVSMKSVVFFTDDFSNTVFFLSPESISEETL